MRKRHCAFSALGILTALAMAACSPDPSQRNNPWDPAGTAYCEPILVSSVVGSVGVTRPEYLVGATRGSENSNAVVGSSAAYLVLEMEADIGTSEVLEIAVDYCDLYGSTSRQLLAYLSDSPTGPWELAMRGQYTDYVEIGPCVDYSSALSWPLEWSGRYLRLEFDGWLEIHHVMAHLPF